MFKPIFLAIQPAVKLVTIPKNSYNKNKYANCNGVESEGMKMEQD